MYLVGALAIVCPDHAIPADIRLGLVSSSGCDSRLGPVDDIVHVNVCVPGAHVLPDDALVGYGWIDLEEGIDAYPSLQSRLQVVHEYVVVSAPVIRPGYNVSIYGRLHLLGAPHNGYGALFSKLRPAGSAV